MSKGLLNYQIPISLEVYFRFFCVVLHNSSKSFIKLLLFYWFAKFIVYGRIRLSQTRSCLPLLFPWRKEKQRAQMVKIILKQIFSGRHSILLAHTHHYKTDTLHLLGLRYSSKPAKWIPRRSLSHICKHSLLWSLITGKLRLPWIQKKIL